MARRPVLTSRPRAAMFSLPPRDPRYRDVRPIVFGRADRVFSRSGRGPARRARPSAHSRARLSARVRHSALNEGRSVNPGDTPRTSAIGARPAFPLNEGRNVNPGDTQRRLYGRCSIRPLNEGRSVNPGDTILARPTASSPPSLNEGRSVNPGDTHLAERSPRVAAVALNEGRSVNPGDTSPQPVNRWTSPSSLNEGRSVNPGDTDGRRVLDAARRADPRSTKAGASTPATRAGHTVCVFGDERSTKAGASTPATRARSGAVFPTREHRSTKAGASTPATPERRTTRRLPITSALNEGRSVNPGDTRILVDGPLAGEAHLRSTKAGASTPATPLVDGPLASRSASALNEGRSVNPGDTPSAFGIRPFNTCTAQRRPERQPRRHTYHARLGLEFSLAQRRPERQPRRHSNPDCSRSVIGLAQRRPERQPRRHAMARGEIVVNRGRSTKAGASTPATPSRSLMVTATEACLIGAQRRPERQPRRHG